MYSREVSREIKKWIKWQQNPKTSQRFLTLKFYTVVYNVTTGQAVADVYRYCTFVLPQTLISGRKRKEENQALIRKVKGS